MSGQDLVQLIRQLAALEVAPALAMVQDGIVETAEGGYASVRVGGPTADPVTGFAYSPSLAPLPGDHVVVYRLGGCQLVLQVLDRNALVGLDGGAVVESGGSPNLDGGQAGSTYGGTVAIDGGAA